MATLLILRIGSKGEDVRRWQYFLIGQNLYHGIADGDFGPATHAATIAFQNIHNLNPDGVVGNRSYGAAMILGFGVAVDPLAGKQNPDWPPKPGFPPLVSDADRRAKFGRFAYRHAPVVGDSERIQITDNWQRNNIVAVQIPQLLPIAGTSKIYFHKTATQQFVKLWTDWERAGLIHLVLTWGGTFNPRFIRGSRTKLSNHAFGTAFDINVAWNYLGTVPALAGQKGSVRELVEIANLNGFYWGGHYTRKDGMHFEVAKIL